MAQLFSNRTRDAGPDAGDVAGRDDDARAQAHERALALLADREVISQTDQKRIEATARRTNELMGALAVKLGVAPESKIAEALAEIGGFGVIRAADFPLDMPYGDKIRADFLERYAVAPIALNDGRLTLAMADPFDDYAAEAVEYLIERPIIRAAASASELEAFIARQRALNAAPASEIIVDATDTDLERLRDLASGAPVLRWVNAVLERAVIARASDIHIEPEEHAMRVRFRIDGALAPTEPPPPSLSDAVVSRLKIMAKLDVSERRRPQDGRAKIAVRGGEVDLRVTTTPSLHGEGVVVRILNRDAAMLDLDRLGLSDLALERLRAAIGQPQGAIFATGPTGSGKTTTLYAALRAINDISRKIVSVEDPVEYRIPGITQIQVQPAIGLDFASALRSVLRQDPDILMIGEIRDEATASVALDAALTGHLVFSTVHTNSAAATITRLHDLGAPRFLVADTLNAIIAQRLVRRLCPTCAAPASPSAEQLRALYAGLAAPPRAPEFHESRGCEECGGSGYRGRLAVCEILTSSPRMRRLIADGAETDAIEAAASNEGMVSLKDEAIALAAAGLTSLDEVVRTCWRR